MTWYQGRPLTGVSVASETVTLAVRTGAPSASVLMRKTVWPSWRSASSVMRMGLMVMPDTPV